MIRYAFSVSFRKFGLTWVGQLNEKMPKFAIKIKENWPCLNRRYMTHKCRYCKSDFIFGEIKDLSNIRIWSVFFYLQSFTHKNGVKVGQYFKNCYFWKYSCVSAGQLWYLWGSLGAMLKGVVSLKVGEGILRYSWIINEAMNN